MSTPVQFAPVATGVDHALTVEVRGNIGAPERERAATMVHAVLARYRHPIGPARIRIAGSTCGGPGLVQVNLRVCGAPARVQVPGPTMTAAISAAATRLRRQVDRLTTAWQPWPWPDPQRRPLGVPGVGRVVRRKAYRLHVATPCQAAAMLGAMDYDVLLYTDAQTGEDAVIYRSGPAGLALARQRTMRPPTVPSVLAMTVNPRRTPTLTVDEAVHRLADGWLPFMFFTDHDTGRGSLLYRRYDGDLGLIVPDARR